MCRILPNWSYFSVLVTLGHIAWRRTVTDKVSFSSLSKFRCCRAVWTVILLHLLLWLWLQHSVRVLLQINCRLLSLLGLFLLLIFMCSWNLIGILHWKWVTYCSVFMGHIVVKWDGGCYLIPFSPDVCPSPLGSSQAVLSCCTILPKCSQPEPTVRFITAELPRL